MRQDEGKEVRLPLDPSDHNQRLTEIGLAVAGRMHERDEHLPCAQATLTNVFLHDRVAAREAVLVPQPLKDPLRRVPLLYGSPFILVQDPVDHTRERVKPGTGYRPAPPVPGRDRVRQHLANGVPVQAEHTRRLPDAHPVDMAGASNAAVELHSVHTPGLPSEFLISSLKEG